MSVPALTVVMPVKPTLAPETVSVPLPFLTREPSPSMRDESVPAEAQAAFQSSEPETITEQTFQVGVTKTF